ncbi:MAG TPA: 2-octaprenyl-6-methoxyphenyl hydroxylase [Steroidobacteraceae bacterium]|nr:2-octaprenyl-6-methoxyphenyl hydroxylase [Steroidobacteraceae bacterium]
MNNQPSLSCDVAIVGGGMVGASLALALAATPLSVIMIEAVPPDPPVSPAGGEGAAPPSFDDRTTALGNGARRIFQTLGVWEQIATQAAPIRQIHVSDAGRFGFARLAAEEHGLAAFGYTVANRHLGQVLWGALRARARVQLLAPARVRGAQLSEAQALLTIDGARADPQMLRARLVVAADGAHSLVKQAAAIASRVSDYRQVAVVSVVRTDSPAAGVAFERFTTTGPLALLPRFDRSYGLIWTLPPEAAAEHLSCAPDEFCRRLQRRFGWRAGRILSVGTRASYPLALVHAGSSVGMRVALIGNAAQALHPIAAQGFNLGLRDAAVLAELLGSADDPGASSLLDRYAQRRAADRRGMIGFTDQLVRVFGERSALIGAARDLALLLFDLSPPAKQALSRLSWGFGALPRLSRGLPLIAPRVRSDGAGGGDADGDQEHG